MPMSEYCCSCRSRTITRSDDLCLLGVSCSVSIIATSPHLRSVLVNKLSTRYLEMYMMSLVELVAQEPLETYIGECVLVQLYM